MNTKTCTKCKETKPLEAFGRFTRNKNGLNAKCKLCNCAAAAAWRVNNPEKARLQDTAYRVANREKLNKDALAYYAANREEIRKRRPTWAISTEKQRARARATSDKRRSEMHPTYVAQQLHIPIEQLTPELLELKRQQLEIHRLTRLLQQTLKEKS